ncbi:hypothetical protein BOTBODRAFT_473260 [Botryobasidium botryosum FD-172 SS1]|uniref:Uncharacterized protein n=1 Tax=Botryobasidium botryosum (strain FD-172 SS1) TaxID=930990 RepID=A0A067MFW3_BOTB1|nr:hypothetical protein BOTBODRAFT_473260 [Botryobasidium botryosum FD-172 SS1]
MLWIERCKARVHRPSNQPSPKFEVGGRRAAPFSLAWVIQTRRASLPLFLCICTLVLMVISVLTVPTETETGSNIDIDGAAGLHLLALLEHTAPSADTRLAANIWIPYSVEMDGQKMRDASL